MTIIKAAALARGDGKILLVSGPVIVSVHASCKTKLRKANESG